MSVAEVETKREHENFFTTTYASLVNWARKSSLWPYPFGTACCAIEFMATMSAHYDIARFGAEVVRFSPKQSDVLMVLGTINDKMGPVLKQIYDQMAEPKWGHLDGRLRNLPRILNYDKFEFDVPVGERGDVYDRYLVRIEEIRPRST